jgi:hypothetical protein
MSAGPVQTEASAQFDERVKKLLARTGPIGRYPYLSMFLFFAILMPLTRPFLRHIPDPPPALGQMPAWQGRTAHGEIASGSLRGNPYLVVVECPAEASCAETREVTGQLVKSFAHQGLEIPVLRVSVATTDPADRTDGIVDVALSPGVSEAMSAFVQSKAPPKPGSADGRWIRLGGRVALVDHTGELRGIYPLTGEHAGDEAMHMARMAWAESRRLPGAEGCKAP